MIRKYFGYRIICKENLPFCLLVLILKLEIWNKDGLLSKKQIQMDGIKNSLKVSKSKLN